MSGSMEVSSRKLIASEVLQTEITRNEVQRAWVMAVLLFVAMVPAALFLTGPGLAVRGMDAGLMARLAMAALPLLVILLIVAAVEVAVWLHLRRSLQRGEHPTPLLAWGQTAMEVLMPTAILWAVLGVLGAADTFGGALSWLYFPLIVLTALHLRFGLSLFAGLLAAAGFILVAEIGLGTVAPGEAASVLDVRHPYYVKAFFLAATGLFTGLVAMGLRRQLFSSVAHAAERDRAVSIFGQHVSPEVASRLLHQPLEETGENRHVCILFLDIRNFSVFAAAHTAPEVMTYLNNLFGRLIDVVNGHGGIVNKFLGDGFMAVFGAPTDDAAPALNAARCACALIVATEELCREGAIPSTRLGIGLHCGESVTGNVGGEVRKEYTVIGDTVNIAARIEQATKAHGAQVLVSEDVWRELPEGEFPGEDLGLVELKGQPAPMRLHKLL